jgi:hypothetical protein
MIAYSRDLIVLALLLALDKMDKSLPSLWKAKVTNTFQNSSDVSIDCLC